MPSEPVDITVYCSRKARELRTDVLVYIPRVDRERCIEALLHDYRRESRLAQLASTGAPLPPSPSELAPQRIQHGMKTALSSSPCFSAPTSFGSSTNTILQKQRKAERAALRDVDRRLDNTIPSTRRLPW